MCIKWPRNCSIITDIYFIDLPIPKMPRNRRDMIYKNAREKVRSRKPHDGNWKVLFLARRQFVSSSFEIEFPFSFLACHLKWLQDKNWMCPTLVGLCHLYINLYSFTQRKRTFLITNILPRYNSLYPLTLNEEFWRRVNQWHKILILFLSFQNSRTTLNRGGLSSNQAKTFDLVGKTNKSGKCTNYTWIQCRNTSGTKTRQ